MKNFWKLRFREILRTGANTSDSSARSSVNLNDLLTSLMGSFGKYQFWLYILVILTKLVIAFHQFAIIFLAPKVVFTCLSQANDYTTNSTLEINKCPCPNPKYESNIFSENIITEWDLICDNRWMVGFTQTVFQFGNLLGSSVFGSMSDRCGRRLPMIVASMGMLFFGVGAAYMPSYWPFTTMRFLLGTCVGGTLVLGFVIIMEFIGDKHRELFSALFQLPFNVGHVILPAIAYLNTDFRKFQLSISLVAVVLILYIFLLPETPRWLLAVNKIEACIEIVEKVAQVNKRPVLFVRSQISDFKRTKDMKKGTCLDLFRTPNLRKNFIIVALTWTTTSYCFYGVSQYVGTLSGNIYINVEISAAVTLFGCFMSIIFMKFFGRRTIIITMNIVCSACLLVMAFFSRSVIGVILATVGTVSSFIAFVVVYLYTSELFPTVVRSAAVGNSSMMARLGSMIAPFVVLLEDVNTWITPVLFGVPPLITACLLFWLPETKGIGLLTTLEEGERFGGKRKVRLTVIVKHSSDTMKDSNSVEHKFDIKKIDETKLETKGILKIEQSNSSKNNNFGKTETEDQGFSKPKFKDISKYNVTTENQGTSKPKSEKINHFEEIKMEDPDFSNGKSEDIDTSEITRVDPSFSKPNSEEISNYEVTATSKDNRIKSEEKKIEDFKSKDINNSKVTKTEDQGSSRPKSEEISNYEITKIETQDSSKPKSKDINQSEETKIEDPGLSNPESEDINNSEETKTEEPGFLKFKSEDETEGTETPDQGSSKPKSDDSHNTIKRNEKEADEGSPKPKADDSQNSEEKNAVEEDLEESKIKRIKEENKN